MSERYWVVGGEYLDSSFKQLVPGSEEETLGPFVSYEEAKTIWRSKSWLSVDECNRRYRIEHECGKTQRRFFVVGGDYADSGFSQLVEGTQEERIGPFITYEDAYSVWHKNSWECVDSHSRRYRIVEEETV